jgi:predicted metalloprotease
MRARLASAVAVSLLVLAACGIQQADVRATRSRQNDNGRLFQPTAPVNTVPGDTTPGQTTVDTTPLPVQEGIVDFGSNKPERSYDGFLTAALGDIEAFWKDQFPVVYGSDFTPLSGGIFAAYPQRTEPIPGCGTPQNTAYADVKDNAFYCVDGDFMVYDDAHLLPQLVNDLGQSAVAIVLAHEFGHAVQTRANEFDQPTILKEQQADCFAGAWAAHLARGETDGLTFSDEDLRSGLIAMIQVRDPVEFGGQIDANSHGTGFDRVGAFEDGFAGGPQRCKTFFTEGREKTLINIPFDSQDVNNGNMPLTGVDPQTGEPDGLIDLLPKDLDRYWTEQLAASNVTLTPPTVTLFTAGTGTPACDGVDQSQIEGNIRFCEASNTVSVDQQFAEKLNADQLLGDMSTGYLIAGGYSDVVQTLLGSKLTGEARALLNDCLTGAWIRDDLPPQPTGRPLYLSAGDLDEAIVTAIVRSDKSADTNVNGSAFEKIDAFRSGVLDGFPACQSRLTP